METGKYLGFFLLVLLSRNIQTIIYVPMTEQVVGQAKVLFGSI